VTPDQMARAYRMAFHGARAWTADEIGAMHDAPGAIVATHGPAFAIGRIVLDEAEVLTIACPPSDQGQGHGRAVLAALEGKARDLGAALIFLEVAEDNHTARALYLRAQYRQVGQRARYYPRKGQPAAAALVLQKKL